MPALAVMVVLVLVFYLQLRFPGSVTANKEMLTLCCGSGCATRRVGASQRGAATS
jgi:hypothetical protein